MGIRTNADTMRPVLDSLFLGKLDRYTPRSTMAKLSGGMRALAEAASSIAGRTGVLLR